jgi:hypothetical protein
MPPPAAPTYQVAEVVMKGNVASAGSTSKPFAHVFHFKRTTDVNVWDNAAIEAAFQTAIAVPIMAAVNLRAQQAVNDVRCIDDANNAYTSVPRAVIGAITGDSMPLANTGYMLLRTGFRGKNWRGNKKFFPLSETDTTIGTADLLNAASLIKFNAIGTALLAGFTDANGNIFKFGIFSRRISMIESNPTFVQFTQVIACLMNSRIGRSKKHEPSSVY